MRVKTALDADSVRKLVDRWHADGLTVGFVPTMGALHEGHLALVRRAAELADRTVASVFVNPTQFGPGEDFARYPRDEAGDARKLADAGCDALFLPAADTIYPPGHSTFVDVEGPSQGLEGDHRPGHFRGVATVVTQLLLLVRPDLAVFGDKDAQQLAVVRRLIRDLHLPVEIVGHPTVREPDGLALSSRNRYLDPGERSVATVLWRALCAARERFEAGERSAGALRAAMRATLDSEPSLATEYAEVVDSESFRPVDRVDGPVVLPIAGRLGATRLIDNLRLAPGVPPADPGTDPQRRTRRPPTNVTRPPGALEAMKPMRRTMLKSKIHRATVTGADLAYEGSVTVDPGLMESADILAFERVEIYDITNGNRFATYAIPGERGRGEIVLNGAAAHRVTPGDLVILCSYAEFSEEEARRHEPRLVMVDGSNRRRTDAILAV